MAAAYLFHLVENHPFIDGNKRAGANAAITFLLMNDIEPTFSEQALVDLVLGVAQGLVGKPGLKTNRQPDYIRILRGVRHRFCFRRRVERRQYRLVPGAP
jgi:death-on-curing family protein